jgi:hypothetical protein
MSTLIGLGGLYLFFKIVVPLILLALVVYFAFQWVNGPKHEFSASEPEELRSDLDDDLRDDVRGPRD